MKRLIILGCTFLLLAGLAGCYKDVILPEVVADPDGPPQAVSFRDEIAPVLNSGCAISGCHVTGSRRPFLSVDKSFTELVSGGFVNTVIPKESILYKEINGGMRQYIPSAVARQKIYDWIRNGAPNN